MKITANGIEFNEGTNIYKLIEASSNQFDVLHVSMESCKEKKLFFFDNDDDPFNDEMIMFHKTEYNKFKLSSIKCEATSNSLASANSHLGLHQLEIKNDINGEVTSFGGPDADCVVIDSIKPNNDF